MQANVWHASKCLCEKPKLISTERASAIVAILLEYAPVYAALEKELSSIILKWVHRTSNGTCRLAIACQFSFNPNVMCDPDCVMPIDDDMPKGRRREPKTHKVH